MRIRVEECPAGCGDAVSVLGEREPKPCMACCLKEVTADAAALRSESAELRWERDHNRKMFEQALATAAEMRARAKTAEAREAELRSRVDMATAVLVRNWQSPELGRRVEAEFRDALKGKFDCQLCSDGPCSPACCGEKGGAKNA